MLKLPYQQLLIWQKAMLLAEQTYSLTKNFPIDEKNGLISQMRRASVSIPSNIAEGSQRGTDKDFLKFICIAKGSLAELETQCILSKNVGLLSDIQLENICLLTIELSKMMNSFITKLSANH